MRALLRSSVLSRVESSRERETERQKKRGNRPIEDKDHTPLAPTISRPRAPDPSIVSSHLLFLLHLLLTCYLPLLLLFEPWSGYIRSCVDIVSIAPSSLHAQPPIPSSSALLFPAHPINKTNNTSTNPYSLPRLLRPRISALIPPLTRSNCPTRRGDDGRPRPHRLCKEEGIV